MGEGRTTQEQLPSLHVVNEYFEIIPNAAGAESMKR